jgi:hypothetical protein
MFNYLNLVKCNYTHIVPPLYPKIEVKDMKPFDLILYHAHAPLPKVIQSATDSAYNHVDVYLGIINGVPMVQGSVASGLGKRPFQDAIGPNDIFANVFRYKNPLDIKMLQRVSDYYDKEKERYGFENLVELLALTQFDQSFILRNVVNRFLKFNLTREMLEEVFTMFNHVVDGGKEPVICSEFGYRLFTESLHPIVIIPEQYHKEFRNSNSKIIQEYRGMKSNLHNVNPEFIIPHDLVMSPSFYGVGTIFNKSKA